MTFCTNGRQQWFGKITSEGMVLNAYGRMAHDHWLAIPGHYQHVRLDVFAIMPDHVHGIIELLDPSFRTNAVHTVGHDRSGPPKGSLGAIVGSFRAGVARQMNLSHSVPVHGLWQRGYHDIIVRDERSLMRMRAYIERHPRVVPA